MVNLKPFKGLTPMLGARHRPPVFTQEMQAHLLQI
jgi:hypothetical protein